MADHRRDLAVPEHRDEAQRVAYRVEQAERPQVDVEIGAPAGGAAVAALVRRDDVVAGIGQRRHHFAPGIGDFREAVQQQHQRPPRRGVPGLEDMHVEAVDVADKAGADAGRQDGGVKRLHGEFP